MYFASVKMPAHPTLIKIGETADHKKRLVSHARGVHGVRPDFQYLCIVRGSRADEQQLHKAFERHQFNGERETYYPDAQIVDYIRWLRDQWFVWVPDDDQCDPVEFIEPVGSDAWMPNELRRKPAPSADLFGYGELELPPRTLTADDFYTNEVVITAARKCMGSIDLDPASHAVANRVVRATTFYSIADDGLNHEWRGNVWLNPPFSQWQSWVPKILSEWKSGRVESMCVLCATRTLTARYFAPMHQACNAFCVITGRIPFWGGVAGPSPDDGHAIFYFGDKPERFLECFDGLGNGYRPAGKTN